MPKLKATALKNETRLAVTTKEAARLLGRRPQTLRKWACYDEGPIRPIRGQSRRSRLLWSVEDIRRLLKFLDAEKQKADRRQLETETPSGTS
jgi:hypothetical protein